MSAKQVLSLTNQVLLNRLSLQSTINYFFDFKPFLTYPAQLFFAQDNFGSTKYFFTSSLLT